MSLLTPPGPPVGREPVPPPRVGEVAKLGRADDLATFVAPQLEPPIHVLFRPEEVHRASGEDDVVPPVRGRDEAVEHELPMALVEATEALGGLYDALIVDEA